MHTIINLGLGVNSGAILAMILSGELKFENPVCVFADVGGEKKKTYKHLEFLKEESPLPIHIVKAEEKDGNLYEYCKKNNILPQRHLRWCTDRWKRKPLQKFLKETVGNDEYVSVIGIAYDERQRAQRWQNDPQSSFPLIDMKLDRDACIGKIKEVGWEVPPKSGCWFCPYAPLDELAELKKDDRAQYDELCEMEQNCLNRYKDGAMKIKGWYHDKYPLDKLLARKRPMTVEGQQCLYCFDGEWVAEPTAGLATVNKRTSGSRGSTQIAVATSDVRIPVSDNGADERGCQ